MRGEEELGVIRRNVSPVRKELPQNKKSKKKDEEKKKAMGPSK